MREGWWWWRQGWWGGVQVYREVEENLLCNLKMEEEKYTTYVAIHSKNTNLAYVNEINRRENYL